MYTSIIPAYYQLAKIRDQNLLDPAVGDTAVLPSIIPLSLSACVHSCFNVCNNLYYIVFYLLDLTQLAHSSNVCI